MKAPSDLVLPTYGGDNRKFVSEAGWLTPYAFACGYIQQRKSPLFEIDLFLDGNWQVKVYAAGKPYERLVWESFDNLRDARRFFATYGVTKARKPHKYMGCIISPVSIPGKLPWSAYVLDRFISGDSLPGIKSLIRDILRKGY